MTDTPHVPDFRWIHDHGLFRVDPDGKIYQLVDHNGEPFEEAVEWTSLFANAVKLGHVRDLIDTRREIEEVRNYLVKHWYGGEKGSEVSDGTLRMVIAVVHKLTRERDQAAQESDNLRADIAASKKELWKLTGQSNRTILELDALRADIRAVLDDPTTVLVKLDRIRAILDRE